MHMERQFRALDDGPWRAWLARGPSPVRLHFGLLHTEWGLSSDVLPSVFDRHFVDRSTLYALLPEVAQPWLYSHHATRESLLKEHAALGEGDNQDAPFELAEFDFLDAVQARWAAGRFPAQALSPAPELRDRIQAYYETSTESERWPFLQTLAALRTDLPVPEYTHLSFDDRSALERCSRRFAGTKIWTR